MNISVSSGRRRRRRRRRKYRWKQSLHREFLNQEHESDISNRYAFFANGPGPIFSEKKLAERYNGHIFKWQQEGQAKSQTSQHLICSVLSREWGNGSL